MSLPRVVIDGRMVGPVPHGIARFVQFMAQGLERIEKSGAGLLPYEPVFLRSPKTPEGAFGRWKSFQVEAPFLSMGEWLEIPKALRALGAKLYHSPSFASLPLGIACPHVITVHDLNHLHYGSWKERVYYRHVLRPFMKKAEQVTTVSEFSRQEIAGWMKWEPARIDLTWNAIEPALAQEQPAPAGDPVLAKLGLEPRRFFLSLTSGKPHKNAARLVEAHANYWKNEAGDLRWPLVLTAPLTREVEGVRAVPGLAAEEARRLMASAGAIVFPSSYEGFGLPPVEGLAAGTPVIASRIPPHEEGLRDVASGEAHWVDPDDFHGWISALGQASRGALARVGAETRRRLVERFSPEQLGQSVDRIYRRVLYL